MYLGHGFFVVAYFFKQVLDARMCLMAFGCFLAEHWIRLAAFECVLFTMLLLGEN